MMIYYAQRIPGKFSLDKYIIQARDISLTNYLHTYIFLFFIKSSNCI